MLQKNNQRRFSGPEVCRLEAHEVVGLLRRGDIAPAELLEAAFARIEAVEPAVNAIPITCRRRAEAAIGRLGSANAGHPGWLAGLPMGIKDLTPVAGVRTTFGTPGLADFLPDVSDPLVERLEDRGGIVVGKTNTPEFGAGGNTFNEVLGTTRNPWNTTLNAAGSSGGAAVSLATGEVWLSHGSDHGGSLRTPAAYNGVVGLRPSPGRAGGGSPDAAYLIEGVQGPMARSVRDCALFLDAMAGFESRFPISFPAPDISFQDAVARADGRIRIAYAPDLEGLFPVETDMAGYLARALEQVEGNGAAVEEAFPELPGIERTYHTLRGLMWAIGAKRLPESVASRFKTTLAENTAFGQALTIDDICDAHLNRSTLYRTMVAFLGDFDVLACPVVGNMPRPVDVEWVPEVAGFEMAGYMDWLRPAFLATVTGLPAISVPVGLSDEGLPVGIQLIGQPRGEAALLAAARAFEVACGGPLGPIDPNVTHL